MFQVSAGQQHFQWRRIHTALVSREAVSATRTQMGCGRQCSLGSGNDRRHHWRSRWCEQSHLVDGYMEGVIREKGTSNVCLEHSGRSRRAPASPVGEWS